MIGDMPRKLPLYVHAEPSRHGKMRFYFRIGKGARTAMPPPNAEDFADRYAAAMAASGKRPARGPTSGTLAWLIARYRETADYNALKTATRRQRDNIFQGVIAKAGDRPYKRVTKHNVVKGRDDRASTPAQARNYLDAMRGLFRWALSAGMITADPTVGVKNPPRPKGQGFPKWDDWEVESYRTRWPLGTKERVWLEVLIGTGARRGDAVILGRQHVKGGMLGVETQKEGVWAYVPILAEMQEAIDSGPTGDLVFIVGETGQPLVKESFGNMFRKACREAGVKKSAHGLRKYAATAYAEAGLSDAELESIFGWVRGSAMAAHYSKNAERQRMARAAAERIRNAKAPHLSGKTPHHNKDTA